MGHIPPAEAEANYYRQLASQATSVATWLKPNCLHETRCGSLGRCHRFTASQDRRAEPWV